MAFQPGLLDTNLPTRVLSQTKLDLTTPVNIFTSLQANKRANQQAEQSRKLSELTLSETEKKLKRQAEARSILQNSIDPEKGTIIAEKAIGELNKAGLFEESEAIQNRMMKVAEARQKEQLDRKLQLGKMADAVLQSENPVDAFMVAREDAAKRGIKLSQGLLNYMPTDEEIQDGRIFDPKVRAELDYYSKSAIPQKGPMSLEDKLLLMRERYEAKKDLEKTKSKVKVEQPLTEAEKSRERIAKTKVGIAQKKLGLEEEKEEREVEKFEQQKKEWAQKNRAYKQKASGSLDTIQQFLDRAYDVAKSPDMKKTSGVRRYLPGGSEVPIFETVGKDLQADIDFLTSLGVIETMAKLKAESPTGSTGFGALSEKEMQTISDAFSLLGKRNISAKKKREEVNKVIEIMERRAREQRKLDSESNDILGPEPTEEQNIRSLMKIKKD